MRNTGQADCAMDGVTSALFIYMRSAVTKKYISYTREMIAENKKRRTPYTPKTSLKTKEGKEYISYTREMIAENKSCKTTALCSDANSVSITNESDSAGNALKREEYKTLYPSSKEHEIMTLAKTTGQEYQEINVGPANLNQLKEVLRKALTNVNVMATSEDVDSNINNTTYVLNIDSPAPSSPELKRQISPQIKQILSEDKAISTAFFERTFSQLAPVSTLKNRLTKMVDIIRPSIKPMMTLQIDPDAIFGGHVLRADEPSCSTKNLLHPKWYYGFCNSSGIDIWVKPNVLVSPGDSSIITIEFSDLYTNAKTKLNYKITYESPSIGFVKYTIPLADVLGSSGSSNAHEYHEFGREKDSNQYILVVWNANIWKCQYKLVWRGWSLKKYMNPNLFNDVTVCLSSGKRVVLNKIQIVLNDEIISKYNNIGKVLDLNIPHHIDTLSYRRNTLFHDNDYSSEPEDKWYRKSEIASNTLLRDFSYNIGKSWSPEYCLNAKWPKNYSGPEWWCADSSTFYTKKVMPSFDPAGDGLTDMVEWYINNDLFIGQNQGAQSYSWRDIGNEVRPGDFATIRNTGHGVHFLYWITANDYDSSDYREFHGRMDGLINDFYNEDNLFTIVDANSLMDKIHDRLISLNQLNSTKTWDNTKPWRFDRSNPINYFRAIQGNAGNRFRISNCAIIRLPEQRFMDSFAQDMVLYKNSSNICKNEDYNLPAAMMWCRKREEDVTRDTERPWLEDGFGLINR